MTTWFTSDHHFSHSNIIKYCNRPFDSAHEMNIELTRRWNERVGVNDIVYHLGDFMFAGSPRKVDVVLEKLNGKVYLVKGNHDKKVHKCNGFADVFSLKTVSVNNQLIVLSHYSLRVWDRKHYGSWHLYGHSHGQLEDHDTSTDVGVDCWDYYPVSFVQLRDYFTKKNTEVKNREEETCV